MVFIGASKQLGAPVQVFAGDLCRYPAKISKGPVYEITNSEGSKVRVRSRYSRM